MVSRREVLTGLGAMTLAELKFGPTYVPNQAELKFGPTYEVPPGACDCHTHVFGDPQQFPFVESRTYTPGRATIDELNALHRALHIDRVVVVHPSVYGTDNSITLDAVKRLGPRARGIAVIDDKTSDATLAELKAAGFRGIRVNLGTAGITDPAIGKQRFRAAIARAQQMSWHVQVYTQLSVIEALREDVLHAPMPIVFDHFGGARAALGTSQPGFDALLECVKAGKAYVKVSGAYRSSSNAPDYPDVAPLARALITANSERILWGSDWPHPDTTRVAGRKPTDISPFLPIDDGRVLNQVAVWAPDPAVRKRILVDNPARLYGF